MLILEKMKQWSRCFGVLAFLFWRMGALCQPPVVPLGTSTAQVFPSPTEQGQGGHSMSPASLARLGLHEATEPLEAEVTCRWPGLCSLGFAQGFSLGVSLGNTLQALFLPLVKPGRWVSTEVSLGYQFYGEPDQGTWTAAHGGLSNFSYTDSKGRGGRSYSFNLWVAHAQEVTPAYTQGLIFRIEQSSQSLRDMDPLVESTPEAQDAKKAFENFLWMSRRHPYISLAFPADLEFANWSPEDTDLPEALRLVGRIAPFYEEVATGESSIYHVRERLFGTRLGARLVYAPLDRGLSDRLAVMIGIGSRLLATNTQRRFKEGAVAVPGFSAQPWWQWGTEMSIAYQF